MSEFYHHLNTGVYKGSIQQQLFEFSNIILNTSELVICNKRYYVRETEAYFYSTTIHQDPYMNTNYQKPVTWNFYHDRDNGKYKIGIMFGDSDSESNYGNMLIRSIYDIKEMKLIEGPYNVVDEIITGYSLDDFMCRLARRTGGNTISVTGSNTLKLIPSKKARDDEILASPRVGLTLNRGILHHEDEFIMRPYRFTTYTDELKEMKATLFISAYLNAKANNIKNPFYETISKLKVGNRIARNWIKSFEEGKKIDHNSFIGHNLSTSDILKMYGRLHT